jgi:hypothetical protein
MDLEQLLNTEKEQVEIPLHLLTSKTYESIQLALHTRGAECEYALILTKSHTSAFGKVNVLFGDFFRAKDINGLNHRLEELCSYVRQHINTMYREEQELTEETYRRARTHYNECFGRIPDRDRDEYEYSDRMISWNDRSSNPFANMKEGEGITQKIELPTPTTQILNTKSINEPMFRIEDDSFIVPFQNLTKMPYEFTLSYSSKYQQTISEGLIINEERRFELDV